MEQELVLALLEQGEIDVLGLVPWGSNYTFLTDICHEDQQLQAIYKPQQGERPLWDFAQGSLCLRERCAFLLSELLGWHVVPPTILREGPQGLGSLQFFVEHDPNITYFDFEGRYVEPLQQIALFDYIANNADRKGGHIIRDFEDQLWGIDQGLCFHNEYKLRTVVWEFAGQKIPGKFLVALRRLSELLWSDDEPIIRELMSHLSAREIRALRQRVLALVEDGRFPQPGPGRPYPWPLV